MRGSPFSLRSTTRSAGLFIALILTAGCSGLNEPQARVLHLEAVSDTILNGIVGTIVTPSPTVRVTDEDGQPVGGVPITFIRSAGGSNENRTASTGADGNASVGRWTLGNGAGSQLLVAHAAGATAVVFRAIASPGPISRVNQIAGDFQAATVGASLQHPLRVRVTDQYDNWIAGAAVTFSAVTGNGTIDGGTAITDAAAIATSGTWILGPVPGLQHVTARAGNLESVFTATACSRPCQEIQLLFVRNGLIYRTNVIGGDVRVLSNQGNNASPSWSPDGQRIAFTRHGGIASGAALYVMNADGTNVVRRVDGFHTPSWSPDGTRLAISAGDCWYSCAVSLLNVDDTSATPVQFATMAAQPAWSPDGRKIAFVSLSGDDGYHELQVLNTDGTGLTVVSRRDAGSINRPAWSPDGQRIAFSKCVGGGCDIYVANVDGSGLTRRTYFQNAYGPSWSPDGTWIAFEIFDPYYYESIVAYMASSGTGNVFPLIAQGSQPAWRPMTPALEVSPVEVRKLR